MKSSMSDGHSVHHQSTTASSSSQQQSSIATEVPARLGPTHWDTSQPIHFLRLEKDKLTVRYKGPGNQQQDVGTIRANRPFSCDSCIDYYEIYIHHHVNGNGNDLASMTTAASSSSSSSPSILSSSNINIHQQHRHPLSHHSFFSTTGTNTSTTLNTPGVASSGATTTAIATSSHNSVNTRRTSVMVGLSLANAEYVSTRHPGWDAYSWGFYSADGKLYHDSKHGQPYASFGFGPGDTIGCGIVYCSANTNQQQIFFTRNGKFLAFASSGSKDGRLGGNRIQQQDVHLGNNTTTTTKHLFYPTIGLHSCHDRVTANFGQKSFMFDLNSLIDEQISIMKKQITSIQVCNEELHSWIREYLYVGGYLETLKQFEGTTKTNQRDGVNKQQNSESNGMINGSGTTSITTMQSNNNDEISQLRKKLCMAIESGNIGEAINIIESKFPTLTKVKHLVVRLHCQFIIEAIRMNDVVTALEHAQKHLQSFTVNSMWDTSTLAALPEHADGHSALTQQHSRSEYETLILDTIGLLAYTRPENSPVSYLLSHQNRVDLSQLANRCVLEANGEQPYSKLEQAQMQLHVLSDVARDEGIGSFCYHLNPNNIM